MQSMTIGRLSKTAGVDIGTVRYYERRALGTTAGPKRTNRVQPK